MYININHHFYDRSIQEGVVNDVIFMITYSTTFINV